MHVINEESTQVSAHQENAGWKNRMWGISLMQQQYLNQRKSGLLRTLLIWSCKPTSHLKRLITQNSNFPLVLWRLVTPSLIHKNQEWNALVEGENGNHILSNQVYWQEAHHHWEAGERWRILKLGWLCHSFLYLLYLSNMIQKIKLSKSRKTRIREENKIFQP